MKRLYVCMMVLLSCSIVACGKGTEMMSKNRKFHRRSKQMKKYVISSIICLISVIICAGCGQNQAVKNVESAISSIGEVSINSNEAIENAENLYEALSDKEKKDVSNYDILVSAKETYGELSNEWISSLSESMGSINAAYSEENLNYITISEALDNFESLWEETPTNIQTTVSDYLAEQGMSLQKDIIEKTTEILDGMLVNNTQIAQPVYIIRSTQSLGQTLVNDHGEFAAYNCVFSNKSSALVAYDEYKAYVSETIDIKEEDSQFSFLDNGGNTVSVLISETGSNSNMCILQVRVPRF